MSTEYSYVPVIAKRTLGSNADGSGNSGSGTYSGYYIWWDTVAGFTGKGWNYIESELAHTGFPTLAASQGLAATYENFISYVNNQLSDLPFPGNLDNVLGDAVWANGSKNNFIADNVSTLGIYGNIMENDPYYTYYSESGCIQAR